MGVDAGGGISDVGGEGEVREPEVLDVGVTEGIVDELVKSRPGEHGHLGVGQVQHHPPYAGHLLHSTVGGGKRSM